MLMFLPLFLVLGLTVLIAFVIMREVIGVAILFVSIAIFWSLGFWFIYYSIHHFG